MLELQRPFPRGQSHEFREQWCIPSVSHPGIEPPSWSNCFKTDCQRHLEFEYSVPCLHADTLPIIPDVQSCAYDRRELVWVWVLGSGFAPNSLRPWSAPLRASAFPPAKGGWSRQSQTCLPGLAALISKMHPRTTGGAWLRHSQADAVSHQFWLQGASDAST